MTIADCINRFIIEHELERRIAEPAPLDSVGCIHCGKPYGNHVDGCVQDFSRLRASAFGLATAPIPSVLKEPRQ